MLCVLGGNDDEETCKIWSIFSPFTAIRNLPRHQFGNLQSKMFPAYFSLVGVCCSIAVASFAYLHPWKSSSTAEKYQLGFLLSAFAFNLTNLFVFTPMTIEVKYLVILIKFLDIRIICILEFYFMLFTYPSSQTSFSIHYLAV